MSEIKRYDVDVNWSREDWCLEEFEVGDVVKYEDHAAIVAQLKTELAEARKDQAQQNHSEDDLNMVQSQAQQESNSASNAAMEYALKNHDLEFLHTGFHGNFDAIRKEWSDAPEAVFIGADPFYKPAPEGDKP